MLKLIFLALISLPLSANPSHDYLLPAPEGYCQKPARIITNYKTTPYQIKFEANLTSMTEISYLYLAELNNESYYIISIHDKVSNKETIIINGLATRKYKELLFLAKELTSNSKNWLQETNIKLLPTFDAPSRIYYKSYKDINSCGYTPLGYKNGDKTNKLKSLVLELISTSTKSKNN